MRLALASLAIVAILAGCGGTPTGGSTSAGAALSYLPADAAAVILISTDVEGDQWDALDRHVFRNLEQGAGTESLDDVAEDTFREDFGLDWEDDVKPLLGNDLAVAVQGDASAFFGGDGDATSIMALETRGGDIGEVLEKANFRRTGEVSGATVYRSPDDEDSAYAVEDDVLIVAEHEEALRGALDRRDSGDGLDEDAVVQGLTDLPSDALLRGYGTLAGFKDRPELRRFRSLPLVAALETFGLGVAFEQDDLSVDVVLRTNGEKLAEDDLPLAIGEDSPEIVLRDEEMSGGNLNQSRTTVFLLRALRTAYPDSRFVRAADRIEAELGIDFEDEILRQFDGPSASYVSPDGAIFAARSEVRDPAALRALLPRLAPHLPDLIDALQGLQSEGMALLFLFAPDAPAAQPMSGVEVHEPKTEDGLWRITGLTGDGPSELHLGLIGDVFVVASSEERAREIAEADTSPAEGAVGAGVLRADLTRLSEAVNQFGFLPIDGEELVSSLEARDDGLHARIRVELD